MTTLILACQLAFAGPTAVADLQRELDAALYRWPEDGVVRFEVRASFIDDLIASSATDDLGAKLLRGMHIQATVHLGTGAVTSELRLDHPTDDPVRLRGAEQVRHGVESILTGTLMLLDMHRRGLTLPPSADLQVIEDGDRLLAWTEGGAPVNLRVDGATDLPESMSVGAPGAEATLRYGDWADAGRLHLLSEIDQLDPSGASLATVRMEYSRIAKRRRGTPEVWFPAAITVDPPSSQRVTIRFEDVRYTPG